MPTPRARIASQLGIALAIVLTLVITGSTLFALPRAEGDLIGRSVGGTDHPL